LNWPLALLDKSFEQERLEFNTQLKTALDGIKANGQVSAATVKTLLDQLRALHARLEKRVEELDPSQYIEAKRYLNFLDDGVRALQDPNVFKYFDRTYEARGKTVADLVNYMIKNGLRFSAAVPGNESAYRALYHSLAAYDTGMSATAKK